MPSTFIRYILGFFPAVLAFALMSMGTVGYADLSSIQDAQAQKEAKAREVKEAEKAERNAATRLAQTKKQIKDIENGKNDSYYTGDCENACLPAENDGDDRCSMKSVWRRHLPKNKEELDPTDLSESPCHYLYSKAGGDLSKIWGGNSSGGSCRDAVKECGSVKKELELKGLRTGESDLEEEVTNAQAAAEQARGELEEAEYAIRAAKTECPNCEAQAAYYESMKPRKPSGWDYALGFTQVGLGAAAGIYNTYQAGQAWDKYSNNYNNMLGVYQNMGVPPPPPGYGLGVGGGGCGGSYGGGCGGGGGYGIGIPGGGYGLGIPGGGFGGGIYFGGGLGGYPGGGMPGGGYGGGIYLGGGYPGGYLGGGGSLFPPGYGVGMPGGGCGGSYGGACGGGYPGGPGFPGGGAGGGIYFGGGVGGYPGGGYGGGGYPGGGYGGGGYPGGGYGGGGYPGGGYGGGGYPGGGYGGGGYPGGGYGGGGCGGGYGGGGCGGGYGPDYYGYYQQNIQNQQSIGLAYGAYQDAMYRLQQTYAGVYQGPGPFGNNQFYGYYGGGAGAYGGGGGYYGGGAYGGGGYYGGGSSGGGYPPGAYPAQGGGQPNAGGPFN